MNRLDALTATMLEALDNVMGDGLGTLAYAIHNGTYTPKQLSEFAALVHEGFDGYDGCMVDVVVDLAELGVSHKVINHCIISYVREQENDAKDARKAFEEMQERKEAFEEEAYKRASGAPGYGI